MIQVFLPGSPALLERRKSARMPNTVVLTPQAQPCGGRPRPARASLLNFTQEDDIKIENNYHADKSFH
jgi:hypothetical protein